MIKKAIFLIFLFSVFHTVHAAPLEGEIFHIEKGVVIKKFTIDDLVYREVEGAIENITDIYRGFEPIPKQGHMVKILFEKPIEINNEWLHDLINEVIIIVPEYEKPYLLIFNDEANPYFFITDYSLDTLLIYLSLKK